MMASIDQDVIRSRRRLIEKQNELIGFVRLNGLSSSLSSEFDRLLNNSVLSNNGLKVAESVVEKWQNVFRATHLSLALLRYFSFISKIHLIFIFFVHVLQGPLE
ncbi:hypothetical protein PPACK8108_LOCUS21189 [Phakopsora pachyrhizi]|uniref:Outer kinetochore protein DAD2 n=1 Tax=Phakopsora pachyrhizi TaxID=170000 RepID=A0AAV0BJB0_PHAPC|nr:hypothetical protein PPACK8108_LOCUS21189 [Phakopsora pachyrhizi]